MLFLQPQAQGRSHSNWLYILIPNLQRRESDSAQIPVWILLSVSWLWSVDLDDSGIKSYKHARGVHLPNKKSSEQLGCLLGHVCTKWHGALQMKGDPERGKRGRDWVQSQEKHPSPSPALQQSSRAPFQEKKEKIITILCKYPSLMQSIIV